jgi:hypothetical protein
MYFLNKNYKTRQKYAFVAKKELKILRGLFPMKEGVYEHRL